MHKQYLSLLKTKKADYFTALFQQSVNAKTLFTTASKVLDPTKTKILPCNISREAIPDALVRNFFKKIDTLTSSYHPVALPTQILHRT
jgi:hypothetical protein